MSKISFFFSKADNKLQADHLSDFRRWSDGIPDGEKWRADFVKIKDERSLKQNNLYWAIVENIVKIENDIDLTKAKLHDYFKYLFLSHPTMILDKEITQIAESHTLSKKDFVNYVERIINWCIQRNDMNPMPEDKKSYWKELKQ